MTHPVLDHTVTNNPLDWIIDILRGADPAIVTSRGECPADHIELERYTTYPSASQPRMLITGASRSVRSAVLKRAAGRADSVGSLARHVGAGAAQLGIDQLALGPDLVLSIVADPSADPHASSSPRTLREYLEHAIDDHEICLALALGPLRPNRKPVLQLMDRGGNLVAFAKVGWDDATRRMVDDEARTLARLDNHLFRDVVVPKLLHHGRWRDMTILVTTPLIDDTATAPPPDLVLDALAEISTISDRISEQLENSAWARRQLQRAAALGVDGDDIAEALDRTLDLHGSRTVAYGVSHGDWSPWNMHPIGRRLGVWDWERSFSDVPVGLDLVHYHFQQAFHASGKSVSHGLDTVREVVPTELEALGIDPEDHGLITVLYMIELALRYAESGLISDAGLTKTRQELIVELRHHIPTVGETTEDRRSQRHDPPAPDKGRLFTRRMLGGSGVPAPVRDAVKSTAKAWGRSTSSRRVLPNTYIVGAQRCGTTSMFRYLTQHRSVIGPTLEKGVHFFDTNYTGDLDWYRSHFPTERTARLALQRNGCDLRVVEASPYYLFHPMVPERIHAATPDARIIVLVRDPIERALSHHNHEVKRGFEDHDFESALHLEVSRLDGEVRKIMDDPMYVSYPHQHHSYKARGHYAEQIARYDALFGSSQVKVVRTTDLESQPAVVVDEVLNFLGVPLMGDIKFPRYNARRYPNMDESINRILTREFEHSDTAMRDRLQLDDLWG